MRSDSCAVGQRRACLLVLADRRGEREVGARRLAGQAQAERIAVELGGQQPIAGRVRGMRVAAPEVDFVRHDAAGVVLVARDAIGRQVRLGERLL